MTSTPLNLLLADDDTDDCFFFKEALKELTIAAKLTTVNDGVQLMELLSGKEIQLPDALFLDLNMPRKSGLECLSEIKATEKLMNLPVTILSTSLDINVVNLVYEKGANYYIRKPGEFDKFKEVIFEAVTLISRSKLSQPARDNFILEP